MSKLKLFLIVAVVLATVGMAAYLPFAASGGLDTSSDPGGSSTTSDVGVSAEGSTEDPTTILPAVSTVLEDASICVDAEIGAELSNEELVDMVGPAVVSIVTETVSTSWFFQSTPQTGAGTGMIVSPDGYVVTNNHVVESADTITVTLSDGRTFEPTSVVTDEQTDLAVLRIDASDLPYLHFLSNSLVQLNELDDVVAVGNVLALPGGPTWTEGVVSNLGRTIDLEDGSVLYDLIQTDAAINAGNSGGPLLNRAGQIVGINVAMASNSENIGFAISTNTAIPVIASLIEKGHVVRPWLGITMLTVNSIVKSQYRLSVDEGVLVYQVSRNSPADEAGLKSGDVITAIDGQDVATSEALRSAIQAHEPGDQVEIEYFRDSEQKTTSVTLGETS